MADYHPLIARAVEGLGSGEARRSLYERARAALVSQLRGIDPPLSEADITRERLALEDAIRKVEAEAVRRSRAEPRPAPLAAKSAGTASAGPPAASAAGAACRAAAPRACKPALRRSSAGAAPGAATAKAAAT